MSHQLNNRATASDFFSFFLGFIALGGIYALFLNWAIKDAQELRVEHSEDYIVICENTDGEILYNGLAETRRL